jgi:hypothetical protein
MKNNVHRSDEKKFVEVYGSCVIARVREGTFNG